MFLQRLKLKTLKPGVYTHHVPRFNRPSQRVPRPEVVEGSGDRCVGVVTTRGPTAPRLPRRPACATARAGVEIDQVGAHGEGREVLMDAFRETLTMAVPESK